MIAVQIQKEQDWNYYQLISFINNYCENEMQF